MTMNGVGPRLRKLGQNLIALPALVVLLLALRAPRRPNLRRIVHKAIVREFRAAAATWIEGQFGLIEAGVPGLDRIGVALDDSCWLNRSGSGWIVQHSDPWWAAC